MTTRGLRLAALLALALGAAACEDTGPGSLTATVSAPVPTGAVIVELVGADITGFESAGGARAFATAPQPTDSVRRVIVVSPNGGALQFRIQVPDVSQPAPRGAIVEAVDPANRKITSLTGYQLRISR